MLMELKGCPCWAVVLTDELLGAGVEEVNSVGNGYITPMHV